MHSADTEAGAKTHMINDQTHQHKIPPTQLVATIPTAHLHNNNNHNHMVDRTSTMLQRSGEMTTMVSAQIVEARLNKG